MPGYHLRRIVSPFWLPICISASVLLSVPALGRGQDAPKAAPEVQSKVQNSAPDEVHALADSLRELQAQVQALHSQLSAIQSEEQRAREESAELRRELELARRQMATASATSGRAAVPSPSYQLASASSPVAPAASAFPAQDASSAQQPLAARVEKLEEDQQLTDAKINDQYQTKVESGSKYRMRLSGIVLLTLFNNRGTVNSQDIPEVALPMAPAGSHSSFGGSLRQSQIGLEVFGPTLLGARTSANIKFDFAGGYVNTPNGGLQGLVRLRTGTIRLDWANTSLIAGQDSLFFAPLEPASLVSQAIPALSYAGNLWAWVPQVRVEHRLVLSENSSFSFQGGILDSVSGDFPYMGYPSWGEASGWPAIAGRIAYSHRVFGQNLTAGLGGFFGRQDWALGRKINGWAGTADLTLPLGRQFTLTSEFYRGSAVGGLGGAIGTDVLISGSLINPATVVKGLDSVGGWVQLQFRPAPKWQFNGAWGMDTPFASQLRDFGAPGSYYGPPLSRNMSVLANFLYQVRSDVHFSMEYRRLRTSILDGGANKANLVNLGLGYMF